MTKRVKTYMPEFRSEAVKMVLEQGLRQEEAAKRLGIPKGTLGGWMAAAKSSSMPAAPGARTAAELEVENARLHKELAEARMERDILKKGDGVFCKGVTARYAFMKENRLQFPIEVISRVFDVSRSGYYDWLKRKPSARAQENERLKVAIRVAHRRSRGVYGTRRLQPELAAEGFIAGRDRIGRLRKEMGLSCKQKRTFKVTTNSNHALPVAPNLLEQKFNATRPNQAWLTDITYIPSEEGWFYLAGVKDLFSCEIVGYAMGARMMQELTGQALFRAVQNKRPEVGLIHRSDRGSQYCAHDYRRVLEQFGMQASMSRRGNCYDNAPMESFWGSLKNELVHHRRYATRAEAEASIREYIEIFYNRQRRHSRLGYVAPAEYLDKFNKHQSGA